VFALGTDTIHTLTQLQCFFFAHTLRLVVVHIVSPLARARAAAILEDDVNKNMSFELWGTSAVGVALTTRLGQ
jgi:hypothetical protein